VCLSVGRSETRPRRPARSYLGGSSRALGFPLRFVVLGGATCSPEKRLLPVTAEPGRAEGRALGVPTGPKSGSSHRPPARQSGSEEFLCVNFNLGSLSLRSSVLKIHGWGIHPPWEQLPRVRLPRPAKRSRFDSDATPAPGRRTPL